MKGRPRQSRSAAARIAAEKEQTDGPSGTRRVDSITDLRDAVNQCRRCSRWETATQGVPGEGRKRARLMLVGEVPGDAEDRAGHPFVGPAGVLLNRALREAGIDRREVFVTNAVKHFEFEQRGKRRLHVKPSLAEVDACNWWLIEELRLVGPKLAVALGATAARGLLGRSVTISAMRGRPVPLGAVTHVWVTVHPSSLLRIPDETQRRAEFVRFVEELSEVSEWLRRAT